jgi:hypothetical protein
MSGDHTGLPADLPVPVDDGAADGVVGREVPDLVLPATMSGLPGLGEPAAGNLVAYVYPMTGTPGRPLPNGWDDIRGARGCTPQSCAYRDALADFERLGAAVVGISAQTAAEQARIVKVFYPVFPPDRDAGEVLAWLCDRAADPEVAR